MFLRFTVRHLEKALYGSTFTAPFPEVLAGSSKGREVQEEVYDYFVFLTTLLQHKEAEPAAIYDLLAATTPPVPPSLVSFFDLVFVNLAKLLDAVGWLPFFSVLGMSSGLFRGTMMGYSTSPAVAPSIGEAFSRSAFYTPECEYLKRSSCKSICEKGCKEVIDRIYPAITGGAFVEVVPNWLANREALDEAGKKRVEEQEYGCSVYFAEKGKDEEERADVGNRRGCFDQCVAAETLC